MTKMGLLIALAILLDSGAFAQDSDSEIGAITQTAFDYYAQRQTHSLRSECCLARA